MEIFSEGFCVSKDYKLASKKLKTISNLSEGTIEQFVHYVRQYRQKRKSTVLSFDVSFDLQ